MLWKEVIKKYGKKMAAKMKKSSYLEGITVSIDKNGKMDIPERDIEIAYKDVTGKKISDAEWD